MQNDDDDQFPEGAIKDIKKPSSSASSTAHPLPQNIPQAQPQQKKLLSKNKSRHFTTPAASTFGSNQIHTQKFQQNQPPQQINYESGPSLVILNPNNHPIVII